MERNKYTQVCIIDSVYAILVFLLVKQCKIDDVLFIFWKNVPPSVRKALSNNIVYNEPLDPISKPLNFVSNVKCVFNFFKLFKKIDRENVQYCGQDHLPFSRLLLNFTNKSFIEYEDGYVNYTKRQRPLKFRLIRKFLLSDTEEKFGHSSKVKKIYLTNPTIDIVYGDIKPKIEWVDLLELWKALPDDKKNFICETFGLLNKPEDFNGIDTFIMTRPLSEDGECSEIEKVSKVKEAINLLNSQNFVIKPHYRETTDYKNYFPNALVVKEKYPLELFFLKYGGIINNIICVGDSSAKYFIYRYFKHIKFTII